MWRWTRSVTSSDGQARRRVRRRRARRRRAVARACPPPRARRGTRGTARATARDGRRGVAARARAPRRCEVVRLEQRVAEDLDQVGDERASFVRARACCRSSSEDLREPDEERRRERPPVVLDEVQVARRDPEPLGELDLGEALARAAARGPSRRGGAASRMGDLRRSVRRTLRRANLLTQRDIYNALQLDRRVID